MGVRVLCFVLLCGSVLGFASDALAWHKLNPGVDGWAEAGNAGMRGITIGPIESSQWPGRGYGSPYSEELLDELARMGTNWISITPFGRIWSLTSTEVALPCMLNSPEAGKACDTPRQLGRTMPRA